MEVNSIEKLNKTWELVNWCEFDKYASKSYCAIHNETENKNLGDITKVDEKEIADFNMMVGGSPCQDFSIAGKQKGAIWTCKDCRYEYNPLEAHFTKRDKCPKCNSINIEKTRSSLLVEWLRVLKEKKPNFAIYENVKNIVGKSFKPTFELFTRELNEYGYNTYWKVLNAKNYGIPQNRERVYLIIIKKELDNGLFKYPQEFDNGIRLKDILEEQVDEKFYIDNDKCNKMFQALKKKGYDDIIGVANNPRSREYQGFKEIAPTLCARDYKDPKIVQIGNYMTSANFDNPQCGRVYSSIGVSPTLNTMNGGDRQPKIMIYDDTKSEEFGGGKLYDTCPTLRALRHGHKVVKIPQATKKGFIECDIGGVADMSYPNSHTRRGRVQENGHVCPTLTAAQQDIIRIENSYRIRKLTPKECYRLMGFSDIDFEKAEKVVSNSQLYKQAGNSIVVDVLFYILIELYKSMPYLFDDIKLGSFFSGIGAFEKALDKLFECINNGTIKNFTQPQVD